MIMMYIKMYFCLAMSPSSEMIVTDYVTEIFTFQSLR